MGEHIIIFIGDDAWRVARVRGEETLVSALPPTEDASPGSRVEAVRRHLAEDACADGPVLLALPSSRCLVATISTEALERGERHRAMAFRLEEHLPMSTEEFIADYVDEGSGEALGVCAPLAELKVIVGAFEAGGMTVQHICPAAFLAAAHAVEQLPEVGAVLVASTGAESPPVFDLVELHRGAPNRWWWLSGDAGALRDRLAAWAASAEAPKRLVVVGGGDVPAPQDVECIVPENADADRSAALHGAKILEGTASPWVSFRRDALAAPDPYRAYYRPLAALAAATALLLLCVSVVACWRGGIYASLGRASARQEGDAFREAMPNQRLPDAGNIKGRLLSERQKLAGLTGLAAGRAGGPGIESVSALVRLHDVLSRMPSDVRYRILELSIQADRIRIDGEAPTHGDADRVAAALRQSGRYDVELPKKQALKDGGVSFLFVAKPHAVSAAEKGTP